MKAHFFCTGGLFFAQGSFFCTGLIFFCAPLYLEYWKLAIFSIEEHQSNFVTTRRQLANIDFNTDFDYQQFGDISRLISFSAWSSESDHIEIDQLNIIDDELGANQYGDSNNTLHRFCKHIFNQFKVMQILRWFNCYL